MRLDLTTRDVASHESCDDHHLVAWAVGCVERGLNRESGFLQCVPDLVGAPKAERRSGSEDLLVHEESTGRDERHERKRFICDIGPHLDGSLRRVERPESSGFRPRFPRSSLGYARLEHELAVRTEPVSDPGQCLLPSSVSEKDLRHIARHGGEVRRHSRKIDRRCPDPRDAVGVWLGSGDGERRFGRIGCCHLSAETCESSCECPGSTAHIEHMTGIHLFYQPDVQVEIVAGTVHGVVDASESGVGEDRIGFHSPETVSVVVNGCGPFVRDSTAAKRDPAKPFPCVSGG